MGTMKKVNKSQKMLIILPIIILLGVIIFLITPKGPILKALSSRDLVDVSPIGDKKGQDQLIETTENSALIKVVAKETGLYKVKKDPGYSLTLIDEKNEQLTVSIFDEKNYMSTFYNSDSGQEASNEASSDSKTGSSEIKEKAPEFAQITSSGELDSYYLNLEKGSSLYLRVERNGSDATKVELQSREDEKKSQMLVDFIVDKETKESTKSKEDSSEQVSEETQPSLTEETSSLSEEAVNQSSPSEETKTVEEENPKGTENKNDPPVQKETGEEESSAQVPIGSPKSYERVLFVETKETDKTDEELEKGNYTEKDSLKKPVFLKNTAAQIEAKTKSEQDSPIIIRDANLSVKTGTAKFDTDDEAGHDSGEENKIIRSFDQIGYLASFSIQNTKKNVEYTDIRYRVIAKMPNAIEVTDKTPRNNGEIANGQYIDNSDGEEGSQFSEGVMESIIPDTGQVFVPIILNVYGAANSTKIIPQFTLEIVSAKNKKTGTIETFNKEYDINSFLEEEVPETTVSAKPSVGIRLAQGEVKDSSVFGLSNTNINAYDVGVVTVLQELPGRDKGDYKGSTFPTGPITYQIKQKGAYQIGANEEQSMSATQYTAFSMKAYSPAMKDRSKAAWQKTGTVNIDKIVRPLDIPNANTNKIYTSVPKTGFDEIGVFSSGVFTNTNGNYVTNVKNSDYVGVLNPYTYNMTGNRTSAATSKAFSSMELIYQWDKTTTFNTGIKNKWTQYRMGLYVDEVSYDNIKTSNDSTIWFPDVITPPGSYTSAPNIGVPTIGGAYDDMWGKPYSSASVGQPNASKGVGNAQVSQGQEAGLFDYAFTKNTIVVKGTEHIVMWDPSAFKYDLNREAYGNTYTTKNMVHTFQYGVPIIPTNTPPYTMRVSKIAENKKFYTWYNTPEEAILHGEIGAVVYKATFDHDWGHPTKWARENIQAGPHIPVTVIGNPGSVSPKKNPLVVLAAHQFVDKDGKIVYEAPNGGSSNPGKSGFYTDAKKYGTYVPSTFDSSGNLLTKNMEYWNFIGDSIFIKNMAITTKTEVKKNLYQSNEDIDIKVTGVMNGSDSVTYDGALTTNLPKGISYKDDSSVDGDGNKLQDPIISPNTDGTTDLRWDFRKLTNDQRKKGIEVNFTAKSDFTQLSFKESGYTDSLIVKTVGEMCVSNNTSINDKSVEGVRSSRDTFIEMLIQQIILSKKANKPAIELGETDPLGVDNTITYKVKMVNNSAAAIPEAKLLDVLPYDGDSRGTKLSGTYTIEEISVNEPAATISYTNSSADEKTDPNTISGWSNYVSGTTAASAIKNAKAVLVSVPSLDVGKEVELTVKVKPTAQKAGDVFVNDASMNSRLNMPVESQAVWTRVYGRELTGVVWYDDNLDGLIGNKSAGGLEEFAKDIPVKLYRTSLADENYKDKLVEASLTGEKFVDSSGNSLIKTDKNGKYTFAAIPEGTYVAEFVIGSRVEKKEFHVTKQQVGDDPTKNSKADPDTYKTPGYKAPLLKDLNSIENAEAPTYKIENVNLGLIRPATIRLFKFETGSAVDANGDGKLSDEEKATGKPLKGATFEIYKKGETTPIATADTDTNGYLMFEYLYKGSYQLKETKAPEGYELIKELIDVEVVEGNQNVALFASDDKSTELPFTGANKWVFGLLIGAAITMAAGFGGITYYYRQPKKKGE